MHKVRGNYSKVEQPMSDHLSPQGRLDPKGRPHCLWCSNKTWTPPIDASGALKIIKKKLKMRKLQPPKVEGSRTQKNKSQNNAKPNPNHQKNSLYIAP